MAKGGDPPRPPPRLGRARALTMRGVGSMRRLSRAGRLGLGQGFANVRRSLGRSPGRRDVDVDFAYPGSESAGAGSSSSSSCLPSCCCCCCCCCLNLDYARTKPGMLRIAQVVLSSVCSWVLGSYALRVAGLLGAAMPAMFYAAAGGALCSGLLLAVALLSRRSLGLLRASLFELMFHMTAAGLYGCHASYLHVATTMYLAPYRNDAESYTYPATVTAYWLGYILAALHALDLMFSLKHYRLYRPR